jgi:hypothetical protein
MLYANAAVMFAFELGVTVKPFTKDAPAAIAPVEVTKTENPLSTNVDDTVALASPEKSADFIDIPTTDVTNPELDITRFSVPSEAWQTRKSPVCDPAPVIVRMSVPRVCCTISDSPKRGTARPS